MATLHKELKVTGMSCGHCEMAVNKSLMEVDGVISAKADHKAGKAVVELDKDVNEEVLKEAVTKAGYQVVN